MFSKCVLNVIPKVVRDLKKETEKKKLKKSSNGTNQIFLMKK